MTEGDYRVINVEDDLEIFIEHMSDHYRVDIYDGERLIQSVIVPIKQRKEQ